MIKKEKFTLASIENILKFLPLKFLRNLRKHLNLDGEPRVDDIITQKAYVSQDIIDKLKIDVKNLLKLIERPFWNDLIRNFA